MADSKHKLYLAHFLFYRDYCPLGSIIFKFNSENCVKALHNVMTNMGLNMANNFLFALDDMTKSPITDGAAFIQKFIAPRADACGYVSGVVELGVKEMEKEQEMNYHAARRPLMPDYPVAQNMYKWQPANEFVAPFPQQGHSNSMESFNRLIGKIMKLGSGCDQEQTLDEEKIPSNVSDESIFEAKHGMTESFDEMLEKLEKLGTRQTNSNPSQERRRKYTHEDYEKKTQREIAQLFAIHDAECSVCKKQIVGHRFSCLVCDDFELCSKCEASEVHSEHAMVRIAKLSTDIPSGLMKSPTKDPISETPGCSKNSDFVKKCSLDKKKSSESRARLQEQLRDIRLSTLGLKSNTMSQKSINYKEELNRLIDYMEMGAFSEVPSDARKTLEIIVEQNESALYANDPNKKAFHLAMKKVREAIKNIKAQNMSKTNDVLNVMDQYSMIEDELHSMLPSVMNIKKELGSKQTSECSVEKKMQAKHIIEQFTLIKSHLHSLLPMILEASMKSQPSVPLRSYDTHIGQ
ncbi:unnamed protein product [Caenorhabditis bovis]|uniref:ZZ-type domain-containing protein n=1 Tax=Caenorhabditis bovis TaxID=2654633 RepID=A0A8S1FBY8_9PELO|nr:unnamed protein product [Caenorhabditis bovis]